MASWRLHEMIMITRKRSRDVSLRWSRSAQVLTQKVIQGVYDGVTTHELDELAAQTAAYMATQHPDFSRLAARISVSNLHKSTDKVFSDVVEKLHKHVHPKTKKPASLIADDVYEVIMYVSRRPRITPKIGKKTTGRLLSWRRSRGDPARHAKPPQVEQGQDQRCDRLRPRL